MKEIFNRNEDPLMSIIVLCYKNQKLLRGMLDSIFMQDYSRIELIVSDDGTTNFDTDEIVSYIEKNKRENIESYRVFTNTINIGTVKHIKRVLPYIEGEYYIMTAADDRFAEEDIISSYIRLFKKNPNSVWLCSKCMMTSPDYQRRIYITPTVEDEPFFAEGDSKLLFSRWARRGIIIPCAMCFKKGAIDLVGGIDENYKYLEDWPLVLKLLRSGYAPLFLDKVTSLHSVGGITNSNERYGTRVRKEFYEDKYLLFETEVEPYLELLTVHDRKMYKLYRKEIMDRNYFLDILFGGKTKGKKMEFLLKNPKYLGWVFERVWTRYQDQIQRKKMCATSHFLLLSSVIFFKCKVVFVGLFNFLAFFDIVLAGVMLIFTLISWPLTKYCKYKAKIRKMLVN